MSSEAGTRRRADAERNIAAILVAAAELFGNGDSPSMGEVAAAAGVRRATLYAHFPSREELIDTVVARAMVHADEVLTALRLDDYPPEDAVALLVRDSWAVLDRYRRLRLAALDEIGEERLRRHHDGTLGHIERLIRRGQDDGLFRADLPLDWLVTTFYAVLHAAADDVDAGRRPSADTPELLVTTLLSVFRAAA